MPRLTGIGFGGLSTKLARYQLILLGVDSCLSLLQSPRRVLQSMVGRNDEVALRSKNLGRLIDKFERGCPSVLWAH